MLSPDAATLLASRLQTRTDRMHAALARELHDELGGLLVAARMDVIWLRKRLRSDDPAIDLRWERILGALQQGIDFKRRVVERLHPTLLDNLGLVPALRWLLEQTAVRAGIEWTADLPDETSATSELAQLDPQIAIGLFRIAEECLDNVARHAQAQRVELRFALEPQELLLSVADDGVGLERARRAAVAGSAPAEPVGVEAMRSRTQSLGGMLRVESPRPSAAGGKGSARGTRVEVRIPRRSLATTASPEGDA